MFLEGFPTDMLGLYVDRMCEPTGDKPLYEYRVSEGSVIEVFVTPLPIASSSSASNNNTILLTNSFKLKSFNLHSNPLVTILTNSKLSQTPLTGHSLNQN